MLAQSELQAVHMQDKEQPIYAFAPQEGLIHEAQAELGARTWTLSSMQSTAIMVAFIQTERSNHLQNEEWQNRVQSRWKIQAWYHFLSALGAHTVPMTIVL